MKNNKLPTAELLKYGLINEDLTFNDKLTPEDIEKFLHGYTIVADYADRRATFQLINDKKSLKVILLERDRNLKDVLKTSINEIQYSEIRNTSIDNDVLNSGKKAFVYDPMRKNVIEYDLLKDISDLTKIVSVKNDKDETIRYKTELLKLKGFLQDKIDQFPEMAKKITGDLNIVSKEISIVDEVLSTKSNINKSDQSTIQLNVNDPDTYQSGNTFTEENNFEIDDEEFVKGRKR